MGILSILPLFVLFILVGVIVPLHSNIEADSCPNTVLIITSISPDVNPGEPITVIGQVSVNNSIVTGAPVTFSGSGAHGLKDVQTDSDGTFSSTGASPNVPGDWIVKASTVCGNLVFSDQTDYSTLSPLTSSVKTSLNLHPVSNVNRGGQIGVSGSLIDGSQNPISGALIRFTGSGSHSLDGVTTGDDGSFHIEGTAPTRSGTWSVQGHFDGNTKYAASDSNKRSYRTMPIAVESLVKTSLNLHPVSNVNRGGQIGVSGSLIDGSQNPISGALIRFTGSGSHSLDGVTTGDDGSFLIEGTAPTRSGTWSVQGHFDGNTKYAASDSNKENYQTIQAPGPKIDVAPPQNNTIPYLPLPIPSGEMWIFIIIVLIIAAAAIAVSKLRKRPEHKPIAVVTVEVEGGKDSI